MTSEVKSQRTLSFSLIFGASWSRFALRSALISATNFSRISLRVPSLLFSPLIPCVRSQCEYKLTSLLIGFHFFKSLASVISISYTDPSYRMTSRVPAGFFEFIPMCTQSQSSIIVAESLFYRCSKNE